MAIRFSDRPTERVTDADLAELDRRIQWFADFEKKLRNVKRTVNKTIQPVDLPGCNDAIDWLIQDCQRECARIG